MLCVHEDSSISEFPIKVQNSTNELGAIGEIISSSDVVIHVLAALPKSWEGFSGNIAYCKVIPLFTKLIAMMLYKEIC